MKSIKLFCLLFLTVVSLTVSAQEHQFIKASSWETLLATAKRENKMVLIDSYFIGCIPCKQMDDEVFPLENVKAFMKKNFVNAKIDFMVEDLGKQLQIKYGVTSFPTFLILNGDGQLVARFSGYKDADLFLKLLGDAMLKSEKGEVMSGFSPGLNVVYPDFYTAMFKARKSMDPVQVAVFMDKNKEVMKEGLALPFLLTKNISPAWNAYFLENYAAWEQQYGKELSGLKRNVVVNENIKKLGAKPDDARFEAYMKTLQPLISAKDWPYVKLDAAESYYFKLHGNHTAFFKFAAANPNDDENKLRYLSAYLDDPKVDAAEKTAFAHWLKLVVKENSGYEVLTIAANFMLAQNDLASAKNYATWGLKKAEILKKDSSYFQEILTKPAK